jgi:hypothetical protein
MKRPPDPTFDQRVADWLEEDPSRAPDEVLGAILAAFPSIGQRRVKRMRWRSPSMDRFAAAAAVAIVVVLGAVVLIPQWTTSPSGPPPPSPSTAPSSPSATEPVVVPPPEPTPATRSVVFATDKWVASRHLWTVWVVNEDGSGSRDLFPDTSAGLIGRTRDGAQVLVQPGGDPRRGFADAPRLAFADVATGQLHPVPTDCPTDECWADYVEYIGPHNTALSPDGRSMTVVLGDAPATAGSAAVGIVDLETGATSVLENTRASFELGPNGPEQPRLSPDGHTIAYILPGRGWADRCYRPEAGALMVASRSGDSAPRELLPAGQCAANPAWSPNSAELIVTTEEQTTSVDARGDRNAIESHDVYLVSVDGAEIRRLTTDRMSNHGAWATDGRISYAVIPRDDGNQELGLDVWVLDPASGDRARVPGTLHDLGDAGCVTCAFEWSGSSVPDLVIALWPRD